MFKYLIVMLMLVCVSGCQTTTKGESPENSRMQSADRNEKLLLRIDKIVGTYDVTVQRLAFTGSDPSDHEQWSVVGSASVSGYPGTFRISEDEQPRVSTDRAGIFLLNGETVNISLEAGIRLTAKVIPELQNTARVVGVYIQTEGAGQRLEIFTYPFDIQCNLGEVIQLYEKKVPSRQALQLAD